MEFFESAEQTKAFAEQAMTLMAKVGVAPNPKNYTLWYTYCTKQYRDLNERIDAALKLTPTLTENQTAEIYAEFFGTDEVGEALSATSKKIQESLGAILDYVGQSGEETSQYGEVLREFSGKLTAESSVEALRELVGGVLQETQRMEAQSRALETQLRESTREIATLRETVETIRQESLTDALTGIANRKSFDTALRQTTREAAEEREPLCLLMADIDHFKRFNDTFGHQLGDQVLRLVGRTLVECIKGRDLAARYGGEEFAVILPNTQLGDAATLAANICRTLASKKVIKRSTGEELGTVTVSIGVALYRPGEPLGELVRRADSALYAAKGRGRNRVAAENELTPAERRLAG